MANLTEYYHRLSKADLERVLRDQRADAAAVERRLEQIARIAGPGILDSERADLPVPAWRDRAAKALKKRIAVMRLAREGYRNAEIARRVGYHPDTVSRIIQRELRTIQSGRREGSDALEQRALARFRRTVEGD